MILWNADAGSFVEIEYDDRGGTDPQIQRELPSWELYEAEVFSEKAVGANPDDYTLEIDGPDPQITAIGLDAQGDGAARAAMENRYNADYFRIVAPDTAGNELRVTLTPEAALNPVLTLYDADGRELARLDAAAAGQAETIEFGNVVKGATYYLRVGAARYASAGAYDLEVAFEMALPSELTEAEGFAYFHSDGTSHDAQTFSAFSGSADITEDVDVDSLFFAGEVAGDDDVSVTPRSGDVAPLVAVYDAATGELLGSTATASEGTTRQLRLPLAARHRYIVAVADDDRSGTGDVEIVIQGPETLSTTPIAIGLDTAAILFDALGTELAKSYLPGGGEDDVIAFGGVIPATTYYLTVLPKDYADQGSYDVSLEFGLVRGSIRGTKFYDLNQDGGQEDTEPGLAGWTAFLDEDDDLTLDTNEPYAVTDSGGNYAFVDLQPGTYRVAQVLLPDWLQTMPVVVPEWIYVAVQRPQLPFEVRRNVVRVYDFDGNPVDTIWHDEFELGDIFDVEIGPGGDVYVGLDTLPLGDGQGEIVQFTYDGEFLRVIDLPEDPDASDWVGWYPYGFDVLSDGSLLVAQQDGAQIVLLDSDGVLVDTFPTPGDNPLDVPQDAGVLSTGEIVYTDRVSPSPLWPPMLNVRGDDLYWTGYNTTLFDRGEAVRDLGIFTIDPLETADGSLYATTNGDWGLQKWDAEGNVLWEVTTLGDPRGLAVARNEVPFHRGPPPPPFLRAFGAAPAASAAAIPTGRGNWNVVLGAGEVALGVDFGNVELSTASGMVFNDRDGDGARDPAEPGLDRWIVYVDLNDNRAHEATEPFDTTHDGGQFAIAANVPGELQGPRSAAAGLDFDRAGGRLLRARFRPRSALQRDPVWKPPGVGLRRRPRAHPSHAHRQQRRQPSGPAGIPPRQPRGRRVRRPADAGRRRRRPGRRGRRRWSAIPQRPDPRPAGADRSYRLRPGGA